MTSVPDEGVDLGSTHVVHALHGSLDLALVGTHINDEDDGAVVLDLLHGPLGGEGEPEDLVLVQAAISGTSRLAKVLGVTLELEGPGPVEDNALARLAGRLGLDALLDGLGRDQGLLLACVMCW